MTSLLLVWSERLLALAILFQTIELLQLRPIWADNGIWRWSQVKNDYLKAPKAIRQMLDFLLIEEHFHRLLRARLACSILVWFIHPGWMIGILFLTTWLISIRWRGIFNGGNDSMTALVALGLWVAQSFSDSQIMVKASFAYIAVQLTASYFIAGYAKLKNQQWRKGVALALFFKTPRYDSPPAWLNTKIENPKFALALSWSVILFEITFPVAWVNPSFCLVYLFLAFAFHLANFYVFGLNRFVFAWLAAYPALYFWSSR